MKRLLFAILTLLLASPAFGGPVISGPVYGTATDGAEGLVELSTDAETVAGTATDRAVTPANLRAVISDDIADAALSGTPVIFSIKDKDGNVFYFKAYPTKTAY